MTQERGRPVDSYRSSTAPTNWVTAASASLSASDLETQCVEISSSVALERVSEETEVHSRVGMWWFILRNSAEIGSGPEIASELGGLLEFVSQRKELGIGKAKHSDKSNPL